MLRKKQNNIEWLEFELLADFPSIVHGVFLRPACKPETILHTLPLEHLISAHQVHATSIALIEESIDEVSACDGLMTSCQKWGLVIRHADCQAAVFYDPIHSAIANVHAGWRGQMQNMYKKTIEKMKAVFGTAPQDLLVCISPSLGPDNAEFINYRTEILKEYWQFQVKPLHFDLWTIAEQQLKACGILPHHIEIARIDTYAYPEDFFSYRREKAIRFNNPTVIGLV